MLSSGSKDPKILRHSVWAFMDKDPVWDPAARSQTTGGILGSISESLPEKGTNTRLCSLLVLSKNWSLYLYGG